VLVTLVVEDNEAIPRAKPHGAHVAKHSAREGGMTAADGGGGDEQARHGRTLSPGRDREKASARSLLDSGEDFPGIYEARRVPGCP